MKKRIFIIVIAVSVIALLAVAGTVIYRSVYTAPASEDYPPLKEEYAKLCHRMQRDSAFSIEGTILLYDSEYPNTVKEETSFSFVKNGRSFESVLGPMQVLSNGHLFLQLDTMNQYLLVAPLHDSALQLAKNSMMPFDEMFSDTAQFRINGKVGGDGSEGFIEFSSDFNPEVKSMKVFYDPASYVVSHAEVVWWKNDMILNGQQTPDTWITRIRYRYPSYKDPGIESKIRNIITVTDSIVEPATPYREYRFNSSL